MPIQPLCSLLPLCRSQREIRSTAAARITFVAIAALTTALCVTAQAAVPQTSLISTAAPASGATTGPIPRYHKFEAAFTLPHQTGNPFDPRVNDVDADVSGPAHLQAVVPAFWDGDCWRVRYAPPVVGGYSLTITRNGLPAHPLGLTEARFRCIPSHSPGFVRRSPKIVQRFVFDNGQPYYPIGIDVAWVNTGKPGYKTYFADMGKAHLNWARVWATYWDGKALEWSPDKTKNPKRGYLLLSAARRWDNVFNDAARNGIYVQMTLQHHGQYTTTTDSNWADNPFNVANGGFLTNPADFFTNPEARRLTEAKFRYVVARWGYSTHLLSYELFNEVQNIGEVKNRFQDVVNWHKEMAAYLRSIDTNHHLITTSISDPSAAPASEEGALAHIGLDYDQVHTYPPDVVSTFAATSVAGVTVPVFYGEWGLTNPPAGQAEGMVHDGLWASLMTPMAGAGEYWAWDDVMSNNWWPVFASAANFVRTFGLANMGTVTRVPATVDTPGARGDLSFAPVGGWGPTTRFDVALSPDGATPNLSGISSYIQGQGNRTMMPHPITFHLNGTTPSQVEVEVGTVAANGAHPTLSLDGTLVQQQDFPAAPKQHDVNQAISVSVPAGPHTVSLFNTGPDWFIAKQITVTGYVPAVAVLAKGNAHQAAFWAYQRDRSATTAQETTLHLPNLVAGLYRVRLWNTQTGKPETSFLRPAVGTHGLNVPLHSLMGDVAGVVVPAKR